MFVLIKSKITGEYKTIYRKDLDSFKRLHNFFQEDKKLPHDTKVDFNFEIIEDREKIKEVLENKFTSKGRSEEYDENLTSVTHIAYGLSPLHISTDKFLIRYWNNTALKDQVGDKENILSRGSYLHKILELWVLDKEGRDRDKPLINKIKALRNSKKKNKKIEDEIDKVILKDVRKYVKQAFLDQEIISKISNLDEMREELEYLATKCLPLFIKEELIFSDTVYSEIFLRIEGIIQGSIDSVVYKDNKFKIVDYKTTSSVHKDTGKPKFKQNSLECLAGYARQIYLYNKLLKETGMTHMFDNESPEYEIIQIHLLSGKYKKFNIPQGLVESQGKIVERVLKWYWDIRNGRFDVYKNEEVSEDSDLEFLSL